MEDDVKTDDVTPVVPTPAEGEATMPAEGGEATSVAEGEDVATTPAEGEVAAPAVEATPEM